MGVVESACDFLAQNVIIICLTLVMFIVQRKRARRIFRLHKEVVVVFTKFPSPGKPKTRLIPALGEIGAARVQMLMTDHIVNRLLDYQRQQPSLTINVHYTGGNDCDVKRWFDRRSCHASGLLSWNMQNGLDLGQRMRNAFMKHFSQSEDRVIIVGSDIPAISDEDIKEGMEWLRKEDDVDMVIGQALDGGYYLIGLNTNAVPHLDQLFEGISWGTDQVYQQQFTKAQRLGLRLHVLRRKLADVDSPDDVGVMTQHLELTREDVYYPRLSIIIPTLNEGASISNTLATVVKKCTDKSKLEIIVADGGSTDDTQEKVLKFAKVSDVKTTLIQCKKGRGSQLRGGASVATTFYLMFLHADTQLPEGFDIKAEQALLTPGVSLGAFPFGLDLLYSEERKKNFSWLFIKQLSFIQNQANFRSRSFELPYGDQTFFLTRPMYKKIGGFPDWPLLEDVHLVEKAWTQGHVVTTPGEPCLTSSRRWEKNGAKATLMNIIIVAAYKCGVSPHWLAQRYYGKQKTE